ncbi:MAG: metallophosphoesterase family protein [Prevotella sp.]|jgi:exonuclease SbcD
MTKILHTSDWHLGNSLYGYDRNDEQLDMLRQIQTIVEEQKPDLFLLSGDIYHNAQAPASVQHEFANFLVTLHEEAPDMDIVVTAGNHDSGARHDIFSKPWERFRVHSFGLLDRDQPLDHHILHFPGKAWVVALPYFYASEESFTSVFRKLIEYVESQNEEKEPVVVMAHITVGGCDFTGHKRIGTATIGGLDAVDMGKLHGSFDYMALGHIHHAQWLGGANRIRYCGSPLPVSFDENYEHSVSIIDIGHHGDVPSLKTVSIQPMRPLITLPEKGYGDWDELMQKLKDFPADEEAYIRLNVASDTKLPPAPDVEARQAVEGKRCRYCVINIEHTEVEEQEQFDMDIHEFQQAEPLDIIKRYTKDTGKSFTDDMETIFKQVVDEVERENNQEE